MTECVSPATISTSNDPLRIPGSVGRIAPGCLIVLVDEEGNPVEEGQYGEILVKHVTSECAGRDDTYVRG
jgi:acyl-coenzyme A synthetase/AMP-(fatty) acid ligase